MEFFFPSRSSQYIDTLTGLPTMQGWLSELVGGALPEAGGLIAVDVANVAAVNQTYGHASGDVLLRQAVIRSRQTLPDTAVCIRGAGSMLFAWLPEMRGAVADAFVSHLRQIVCAHPVALPGGKKVYPKLVLANRSLDGGANAFTAVQSLEQELLRQPDLSTAMAGSQRTLSTHDELEQALQSLRLFGRDDIIRQLLTALHLPTQQPRTVLVLAPPQADKIHLLSAVGNLLGGQQVPVAEVFCHHDDQSAPFSLLIALIYRFLTAFPAVQVRQRLQAICRAHPWIGGLFPTLCEGETPPPLPTDRDMLRDGQAAILLELVRAIPHIAIVHSLHLADEESLRVLGEIQQTPQQGLRLIAGVDPDPGNGVLPSRVQYVNTEYATILEVPPLTPAEVAGLLKGVTGNTVEPDVAAMLFQTTGGWPLSIAHTLRSWVENGLLAYAHGQWIFYPTVSGAPQDFGLGVQEMLRLAEAAMVTPTTVGFLAALWRTTEDDARITVERARAFGYIRQVNPQNPELLQFTDPEQAAALVQSLTHEQRTAIRAIITRLQRATQPATAGRSSAAAQAAYPADIMIWEEPDTPLADPQYLPELTHAVSSLRLAGIQMELYPPESKMVRDAVQDALPPLRELLSRAPRLALVADDSEISFGGQRLSAREMRLITRDMFTWMQQQEVAAIEFTSGLDSGELAELMQFLITPPADDPLPPLDERLAGYRLRSIRLIPYDATIIPQHNAVAVNVLQAAATMSEEHALPSGAAGPLPSFIWPMLGIEHLPELESDIAPSPEVWARLTTVMDEAPIRKRQIFFTNLGRWLRERKAVALPEVLAQIDTLLVTIVQKEYDPLTLHEITVGLENRLSTLIAQQEPDSVLVLLEAVHRRLSDEPIIEVMRNLSPLLDRVGASTLLRTFLEQTTAQPGGLACAHRIVEILGERALRPIVHTLKSSALMQERVRAMQLLREFGDVQQTVLLEELQEDNPWFVYRNLLQILAEVGTEHALSAVREKIRHADPRVRAEAVATAVRIAQHKALPYLVQGLADDDAQVRGRAASVAGLCPLPRVLELVLKLLLGNDEPDNVQLAACLVLGHFHCDQAREALLQILYPQLFSPYRKKDDELRSAAVVALAGDLAQPAVQAAIQQAMRDRSAIVSQTAQRVWQQRIAQSA